MIVKMRTESYQDYRDEVWEKILANCGTLVAVVLKGRCPFCGREIDIGSSFKKPVVHLCPELPKSSATQKVASFVVENGGVVLVGSPPSAVAEIAASLHTRFGIFPLVLTNR